MASAIQSNILLFYGMFLICCGINAVVFIGLKAKTALVSGGLSGALAILISYYIRVGHGWAGTAGVVLSLLLFGVFAWRSTKTLHAIFELIPVRHADLKGKGIAFLIISLMAVVSFMVFMRQIT